MPSEEICQFYRVRLARIWTQWLKSFGGGVSRRVQKYFLPKYGMLTAEKINWIFDNILKFVDMLYHGFDYDYRDFNGVTHSVAKARSKTKRKMILDDEKCPPSKMAAELAEYKRTFAFIPKGMRKNVAPRSGYKYCSILGRQRRGV